MKLGPKKLLSRPQASSASKYWDRIGAAVNLDLPSIEVGSFYRVQSPVVLIMFNRPNLTRRVFDAIAAARPRMLFVVSDGPRSENKSDVKLVKECREIIKSVDWDCEVFTKFSEENLGCRDSVASGLSWVFSKVDRAIILEDDCLPSIGFFQFCDELLELYKSDEGVGSICGSNLDAAETKHIRASYYPSRYPAVWGWGTWRRVWNQYNSEIKEQEILDSRAAILKQGLPAQAKRFWLSRLKLITQMKLDTWDYQLVFLHWRTGMKSLVSKLNLVSNLGFGEGATHTISAKSEFANIENLEPVFPLVHPSGDESREGLEMKFGQNRFGYSRLKLLVDSIYFNSPKVLQGLARRLFTARKFSGRGPGPEGVPD